MSATANFTIVTAHLGRVATLTVMSVGLFALAAVAQTAKDIKGATALVAVANEVGDGKVKVVPDVLVTGGGGSFEGLAATLMQQLAGNGGNGGKPAAKKPPGKKPSEAKRPPEPPRSGP